MVKIIFISVIISVILSSLITLLLLKITSDIFTKVLRQTETRFDKKIHLKEISEVLRMNPKN